MLARIILLFVVCFCFSFTGMTQDSIVYPPLVFSDFMSPNNDGDNDYFIIQNIGYYEDNTLEVFNRWGEKIYEAKPYINDWNGKVDRAVLSNEAPDGTYFFVLNDGFNNTYNGRITIKRK